MAHTHLPPSRSFVLAGRLGAGSGKRVLTTSGDSFNRERRLGYKKELFCFLSAATSDLRHKSMEETVPKAVNEKQPGSMSGNCSETVVTEKISKGLGGPLVPDVQKDNPDEGWNELKTSRNSWELVVQKPVHST